MTTVDPVQDYSPSSPNAAPSAVQALTVISRDTLEGPLLASAADDGAVRLLDLVGGRPFSEPLTGHRGAVRALAALRAGGGAASRLASAGDDGTVRLWDPIEGKPFREPLTGHHGAVRAPAAFCY